MSYIFQEYTPVNPNILIGENSIQSIWKDWTSEISTEIGAISLKSPRAVENVIEDGSIYLANNSENKLMKLDSNGRILNKIAVASPLYVSPVNLKVARNSYVDGGVWVLLADGQLLRYNKDLILSTTVSGLTENTFISADTNENCAVANNDFAKIAIVDKDGNVLSSLDYSDFSPVVDTSNKIVTMRFDANSDLFVLTTKYIYKVETSASYAMKVNASYNIEVFINTYSYAVGDMDIDLMPDSFVENESSSSFSEDKEYHQDIYVACGDYDGFMVLNFDNQCVLKRQKRHTSQAFPYVIRVGKGRFSGDIGILTNTDRFVEPEIPWESSSSSDSSSSISPTEVFIANQASTYLSKLSMDDFSIGFYGNHIVLGSSALVPNPNNNRVYYVSAITDEIYYYDLTTKTNVLIGLAPATGIHRIVISPDESQLWLSVDSTLWICDISTGAVLKEIILKETTLADIESYGGMELHPSNGYLYLSSGYAIFRIAVSSVNVSASTIYLTRIANKPAITNYLTDITFSLSGEMFVSDCNYDSLANLYKVNYSDAIITYDWVASYDELIDAMGSGTGL